MFLSAFKSFGMLIQVLGPVAVKDELRACDDLHKIGWIFLSSYWSVDQSLLLYDILFISVDR